MALGLRDGLSFCLVDGHPIFLDLEEDRYFELSDRLGRLFLSCLSGKTSPCPGADELVKRNILTRGSSSDFKIAPPVIAPPSHSALEYRSNSRKSHNFARMEVFAIVFYMQIRLKNQRLQRVIEALIDHRQHRTMEGAPANDGASLLEAANVFRWARPYVPIETCCLLDSLSMLWFLARRRLSARLVFGVTRDPFAAHCWVQAGDWVLNDTVGNVAVHTPIREV